MNSFEIHQTQLLLLDNNKMNEDETLIERPDWIGILWK